MSSAPIALVEPQMEGVAHAPFNAALLHTVVLAYADAPISFYAAPSHIRMVQEILSQHAPAIATCVQWQELPASTDPSLRGRWRHNARLVQKVLALRQRILFCSISRMQLYQLKRRMTKGDIVRAVMHGELELIEMVPRERFPVSMFSLHRVLLRPQRGDLRYVLLGRSIRDNIPPRYREPFANAGILDHPYHFSATKTSDAAGGDVCIGIFGNTGDGKLLETVARCMKNAEPGVRFRLVGFVADRNAVVRLQPLVEDVGNQPLSREVFLERAKDIQCALWLAPPGSFRLRPSGTFFDALSHAKFLIYTANPFLDGYYRVEPEIGVRCETVDEVCAAILRLARTPAHERYGAAQAAILRLRERFTPEAQANRLPGALDWD
jgi:hypothetical protein